MTELIDILEKLIPNVAPKDALLLFLLIFTRWLMVTITLPFLGAQLLPSMVRIALASVLSCVSFMMLIGSAQVTFNYSFLFIGFLFLKEAFLGFLLGFFASIIFYAYELFGELIDFSRGASMARLLVPEVKHQSSVMGALLFQLSLVLFLSLGLHREIISALYRSFTVFPVWDLNSQIVHNNMYLGILSVLFQIALQLALPVIFVCFLIDLGFGLMNRVAPQINAYFLSLPAKMVGGLVIISFVLPFLIDDFLRHTQVLSHFFHSLIGNQ